MGEVVESLPGWREYASTESTEMMRYCESLCKVSDDVTMNDFE